MKKKIVVAMLLISMVTGLLTGCGKNGENQAETENQPPVLEVRQQPQVEEAEEPVAEESTTLSEERESRDGQIQSYLTGEWIAEEKGKRRPIAVMIPNNTPAMPQRGLSKAAIIYEAPVEGRITRLMVVLEDFDDIDRIGPIRSSRDYFIYTALGYEAIYCNWGLARPYVEELINSDRVQNVSAAVEGIYNPADEAYGRYKRPGYALEFTGYLFIDGLKKAVDRLGYDWNYDDAFVPPFTFTTEGVRAESNYEGMPGATRVYPGGKDGSNQSGYGTYHPVFEYHEDDGLYYRSQAGNPQIDELDGNQVAVSNVVFQYCHGEVRDDHDYLAFGVHGEGKSIVFTGGKVIEGTWKRNDGDNVPAKFYDNAGNEVIFNQGKTWICNIWDEYGEFVQYE